MQLSFLVAKALLESDFASYFASLPSADVEPGPIVLREGKFERTSRVEAEERGTVTVAVMVVREVAATAEADALALREVDPPLRLGAGGGERETGASQVLTPRRRRSRRSTGPGASSGAFDVVLTVVRSL